MCCLATLEVQTEHVLGQNLFTKILSKAQCDTGLDADCVGMTASYFQFTISFYGDGKNGYALNVEDFGRMEKGGWIQYEPTTVQLDLLQKRLEAEVERIEQHIVSFEVQDELIRQEEFYEEQYGHAGALYSKYY